MRLRFLLSAALLLAASLPVAAQFQWGRPRPPQAGACFYKDANFQNDYFCLKPGENWPSMPGGFNDRISSIRLFGGVQVRIFDDVNFNGGNSRISRSVPDLGRYRDRRDPGRTWNDRVSSIAVYRAGDQWDRRHP